MNTSNMKNKDLWDLAKSVQSELEYLEDHMVRYNDGLGNSLGYCFEFILSTLIGKLLQVNDCVEYFKKSNNDNGFLIDQAFSEFDQIDNYPDYKRFIINLQSELESKKVF